jgi:hypothetical protein
VEGEVIGLVAVLMVFGIPLTAIMAGPFKAWLATRERREARQLYERLTLEKLDVIKTAVAVGTDRDGLADLDTRLERLIGADHMKSLLLERDPHAPAQDLSSSLSREEYEQIYGTRAGRRAQRQ